MLNIGRLAVGRLLLVGRLIGGAQASGRCIIITFVVPRRHRVGNLEDTTELQNPLQNPSRGPIAYPGAQKVDEFGTSALPIRSRLWNPWDTTWDTAGWGRMCTCGEHLPETPSTYLGRYLLGRYLKLGTYYICIVLLLPTRYLLTLTFSLRGQDRSRRSIP